MMKVVNGLFFAIEAADQQTTESLGLKLNNNQASYTANYYAKNER